MADASDTGVIFWDFDGTLAHRPERWSGTLYALLREHDPATTIRGEQIIPFLQTGFPWHTPDVAHPELNEPERWWAHLEHVFLRAYLGVGLPAATAPQLARSVRARFLAPEHWMVYDDVWPVLAELRARGWQQMILSNHVPELPELASALGLTKYVDAVITSATAGYEKPHPALYRRALEQAGRPAIAWMVGDNLVADVLGAEQAGLRGILVRGQDERAAHASLHLAGVLDLVGPLTGDVRISPSAPPSFSTNLRP